MAVFVPTSGKQASTAVPVAAASAEVSRLIAMVPPKIGTHCHRYDPGLDTIYASLVIADVKCEPLDDVPDSLKFHLFTDRHDQEKFLRLLSEEMYGDGVGCNDLPTDSPWANAAGKVEGRLLCGDYSHTSRILWSYDDLLMTASAAAPPQRSKALHEWWQRAIRFDERAPPAAPRGRLYALLPSGFHNCKPLSLLLPMALGGIICEPGDGITSAGAELFPNERLLTDYIELQAGRPGIDRKGCKKSPFSYTSYGAPPDFRPTLGTLVCHPEDGVEWFSWTADHPLVYAFAARADNDFRHLFHQWSVSLSMIRNLNGPSG